MIDLNEFYAQFSADPLGTKFKMVQSATKVIFEAVQEEYYGFSDLKHLNYSEIWDCLGWPDFQDNGIFMQAVDIAADTVLRVMGYKPQH